MIKNLSNEYYKKIRKTNLKKDLYILIEGERLIFQLITYNVRIVELYIKGNKVEQYKNLIELSKCHVFILSDSQSEALSETKQEQGIFALIEWKLTQLENNLKKYIYLNNITDPGNLGTIIRTASAFGIEGLVIDNLCCDLFNPKVVRASMGALFVMPILRVNQDWIGSGNRKLCVTVCNNEVISLNDYLAQVTDSHENVFVIGSEAHGVSDYILNLPHEKVTIHTKGNMQSLNVAIATGIMIYEISRCF